MTFFSINIFWSKVNLSGTSLDHLKKSLPGHEKKTIEDFAAHEYFPEQSTKKIQTEKISFLRVIIDLCEKIR